MTLGDLLGSIGPKLEHARIPYMVTGSVASSYHGEPRATRDLDVVIDPTPGALAAFLESLPRDTYYLDADAAIAALRERTQFNVIDSATGWKVDLIIRKDRPFSAEEFGRRLPAKMLSTDTFVATPEDVIIAKLEWANASGSDRQLRDVESILAAAGEQLDRTYLDRWISQLGLTDAWASVLADRL